MDDAQLMSYAANRILSLNAIIEHKEALIDENRILVKTYSKQVGQLSQECTDKGVMIRQLRADLQSANDRVTQLASEVALLKKSNDVLSKYHTAEENGIYNSLEVTDHWSTVNTITLRYFSNLSERKTTIMLCHKDNSVNCFSCDLNGRILAVHDLDEQSSFYSLSNFENAFVNDSRYSICRDFDIYRYEAYLNKFRICLPKSLVVGECITGELLEHIQEMQS